MGQRKTWPCDSRASKKPGPEAVGPAKNLALRHKNKRYCQLSMGVLVPAKNLALRQKGQQKTWPCNSRASKKPSPEAVGPAKNLALQHKNKRNCQNKRKIKERIKEKK